MLKEFKLSVITAAVMALAVTGLSRATSAAEAPSIERLGPNLENMADDAPDVIDFVKPEFKLQVVRGRSVMLRMKEGVMRVSVATPAIANVLVFGPKQISVSGISAGQTTLTLWLGNEQQNRIVRGIVDVMDPAPR